MVLEGHFEFTVGDGKVAGNPGDTVVIPSGAKHAFTNVGDCPGRLTIFNAPGTVHDIFFTRAGDPVPEDSWEFPEPGAEPDLPRVMASAEEAGMTLYPPGD